MNKNCDVEIFETTEYGVTLECSDIEVADQFEDFLNEHCFVLFQVKLETEKTSFFFGQASSPPKVSGLYERFAREKLHH